jgi:hypothetical protein
VIGLRQVSLDRFKQFTGLDRAIAYTLLARVMQILSSFGTVLLIVHFMTPIEQGYYYTLLSLVALQTIFELGFSFVILQLAAHESVNLTIHADGLIEGDTVAHGRLASILQLTIRWYLRAAVMLAVILIPLGVAFFSRKALTATQVSWVGPWLTAALASSVTFFLTPLYSFLEGCNQVHEVAKLRMFQALTILVISWSTIASHHGLYACALVNIGVSAVGASFLLKRRSILMSLLRYSALQHAVSWRYEVWPFQWKIAVSWMCSYFTMQIFTPILFAYRGPLEAGRMGLSLSIVGYLPIVALSWIATKATPFGQLIKLGRTQEADALFSRTMKQSTVLIVTLVGSCFAAILSVQRLFPNIAERMEAPRLFALLLLTAISCFWIQSMGIYLRSFKKEPYLVQSIVVALLTVAGTFFLAPQWGSAAIAIVYFITTGIVGLPWARLTFVAQSRSRNRAAMPPPQSGEMICATRVG